MGAPVPRPADPASHPYTPLQREEPHKAGDRRLGTARRARYRNRKETRETLDFPSVFFTNTEEEEERDRVLLNTFGLGQTDDVDNDGIAIVAGVVGSVSAYPYWGTWAVGREGMSML
jgi:hypothetical protein